MADGLQWNHNKDYIFWAGMNTASLKFSLTDVASMGIDHITWDGKNYQVYPIYYDPTHKLSL